MTEATQEASKIMREHVMQIEREEEVRYHQKRGSDKAARWKRMEYTCASNKYSYSPAQGSVRDRHAEAREIERSAIADVLDSVLVGGLLATTRQPEVSTSCKQGGTVWHRLCASCDAHPSTVCETAEGQFFFQMGISANRYYTVWAALSETNNLRATQGTSTSWWCRSANRAMTLITEIEIATVDRDLLYVPSATVLSLDEDHLRMVSGADVELTNLTQYKTQKGPQTCRKCLVFCLKPLFIACHFTRCWEKLIQTWERLVQLVQGAATTLDVITCDWQQSHVITSQT